jgi:branched-chain amino acid transport system permease protein
MHSPGGAILGGLFLQFFPDVTAGLGKGLSALLYAVLLIAAIIAMPEGIAGALKRLKSLLGARHSSGESSSRLDTP